MEFETTLDIVYQRLKLQSETKEELTQKIKSYSPTKSIEKRLIKRMKKDKDFQ